jgi:hypothetical protein
LDVGAAAHAEPGGHPLLEAEPVRRNIGSDDHLLVGQVEVVECMEELGDGLFFVLKKLDVIDEENINVPVAALEGVSLTLLHRVDEIVEEFLRRGVQNVDSLVEGLSIVADGVKKMGLTETRITVDEQGVVSSARRFRDGDSGSVRVTVGFADDERVECVFRVE